MHQNKYIYTFIYDNTQRELCKLESRCIFDKEEKNKLLFSDKKVEPSSSAFIRKRLEISLFSEDYSSLIKEIKNKNIRIDGFKVEYLILDGDTTKYAERLEKLREIGYSIDGDPEYYNPTITYALCYYEGIWYFGMLIKNDIAWHKHKQKPCSYSNSISMHIAKALVNIAAKANKETKLLDACCGVGTIMLEACFAGNNIEGCDINEKICNHARENLSHFNYTANVYHSDIKDISRRYEAAIIDLPYNLFTSATDSDISHIIESAAEITDRLIIVSTSDIKGLIHKTGFKISDYCSVSKRGKVNFARKIWVCEKNN
ncbi:methyltransferase domain-containing protein [Labilibaculum sp. DW002]|uniref:Methyltransferase domain-containing protein n=1 Tax=Paralabilibaculum antarcticum TaxID=2912572 RepID=A0ABT5VYX0_9BACT|nr:methyltransferase domain-containing protein [Labilibaculum sp. DW002]MDE5419743.1 methyltransferase domain-containing protein [Labilibaculum sp. DW002]